MVAPVAAAAAPAAGATASGAGAAAAGRGAAGAGKGKGRTAGGARKGRGKSGRADKSGAATKTDVAELRRQAAAGDQMLQEAYEAGLAGDEFSAEGDPMLQQAYESGVEERQARAQGETSSSSSAGGRSAWGKVVEGARSIPPKSASDWVNDGAGFVLGLLVYALVLNYLQGGAPQARGWIAAKFINKPYTGTSG